MKVAQLQKGKLYIPRKNAKVYSSKMEDYYYCTDTKEISIPQNVFFVSIWMSDTPLQKTKPNPILYLGRTREEWTIDQYYYRCYTFHWGLVKGNIAILNFNCIQNLLEISP